MLLYDKGEIYVTILVVISMKYKYYFLTTFLLLFFMPIFVCGEEITRGEYVIVSKGDINKTIDICGGSIKSKGNIQLYERNFSAAQKWKIEEVETNLYKISPSNNTKYALDVSGGNFKSGTNVQLYKGNGSKSQKWRIIEYENGGFKIESYDKRYVLDVSGGVFKNESNIQIYKSNDTNSQIFLLEKVESPSKTIDSGMYKITSALNNNMSLDVTNSSISNGTNIRLYEQSSIDSQKWEIIYEKDGYYRILSYIATNRVLDVAGGSTLAKSNLQLYTNNNSVAQKWIIKENSDGTYSFISKRNGLYIDVSGGRAENDSNVWLYGNNGSASQKWNIETIDSVGSQTIRDGYYFINTKLNLNKSVDVKYGTMVANGNVQLYDRNSTQAQKWYVEYKGDGYYQVQSSKDRNFVLTNGNIDDNVDDNVFIDVNENKDNQLWIIRQAEEGYYSLISKINKYVDVAGGNTNNETNIQIYDSNDSSSQKFKFIPTSGEVTDKLEIEGLYYIESANDENYVVDIFNGRKTNGTNIQLYRKNGTTAQKWYLRYIGDGYYTITSYISGKSLDIAGGNTSSGANVQLYDYNNTYAQQWILKDTGDGTYNIVSNAGGMYLDLANGYIGNGSNIQMYQSNGTAAQKFRLRKTTVENKVIDVSAWQGNIDWYKVSKSGVYGVILRVGAGCEEDYMFSKNIAEVKKYRIPYGIYIYNYAENYSEGVQHAEFMKSMINKYGLNPTLGIYLDLEANKLTEKMGVTEYTNVVNGFLSVLPNAKLYTYLYYANTALNSSFLRSKITWIAQYYDMCTYSGYYDMWQYTKTGRWSGINGDVDVSILYHR